MRRFRQLQSHFPLFYLISLAQRCKRNKFGVILDMMYNNNKKNLWGDKCHLMGSHRTLEEITGLLTVGRCIETNRREDKG